MRLSPPYLKQALKALVTSDLCNDAPIKSDFPELAQPVNVFNLGNETVEFCLLPPLKKACIMSSASAIS